MEPPCQWQGNPSRWRPSCRNSRGVIDVWTYAMNRRNYEAQTSPPSVRSIDQLVALLRERLARSRDPGEK
jgi:hypothetical protein